MKIEILLSSRGAHFWRRRKIELSGALTPPVPHLAPIDYSGTFSSWRALHHYKYTNLSFKNFFSRYNIYPKIRILACSVHNMKKYLNPNFPIIYVFDFCLSSSFFIYKEPLITFLLWLSQSDFRVKKGQSINEQGPTFLAREKKSLVKI